jgi:hypothetical protein
MFTQSGCAHYYWPASQLETPEAIGNNWGDPGRLGRLEIAAIQSGTDLLEPASEQGSDPETGVTPDPTLAMSFPTYAFGVNVGVMPELDVGIRAAPFAPVLGRVKYQMYGDPELKAAAGNLSVSAAASVGLLLATYSGESVTFYQGTGTVIGGYRFAKNHVASLAPFVGMAGISGVGDASGSGFRFGGSLGYQYDAEALIWRMELTWASGSVSQASGSAQAGGFFPGIILGVKL